MEFLSRAGEIAKRLQQSSCSRGRPATVTTSKHLVSCVTLSTANIGLKGRGNKKQLISPRRRGLIGECKCPSRASKRCVSALRLSRCARQRQFAQNSPVKSSKCLRKERGSVTWYTMLESHYRLGRPRKRYWFNRSYLHAYRDFSDPAKEVVVIGEIIVCRCTGILL